jgi:hypothetical protein
MEFSRGEDREGREDLVSIRTSLSGLWLKHWYGCLKIMARSGAKIFSGLRNTRTKSKKVRQLTLLVVDLPVLVLARVIRNPSFMTS